MLYLQIASPKSSVLNFLDSNSFEVIISIFQRTEKVPDMERLRMNMQDKQYKEIVDSQGNAYKSNKDKNKITQYLETNIWNF